MKTILITGATGFVGKNFIELLKQTDKYIPLALVDEFDQKGINFLKEQSIKYITINDFDKSFHIDYCLHLASYGVAYGARDIDTMIDVNIKLAAKVANFCSKSGCKLFLNTGSCFEYGSSVSNRLIKETDILNPEDIYAASKVACENFLNVYTKVIGLKMATIRPFSLYGKYENSSRIMPLIFKHGLKNEKISLTGGEQIRDYMDVKDLAKSIYLLFENENKILDNEAINICSGVPISLKDFINFIVVSLGFNESLFLFGDIPYRKNESMYFAGSNSRLFEIIGFHDFSLTKEKIDLTFKWYKEEKTVI